MHLPPFHSPTVPVREEVTQRDQHNLAISAVGMAIGTAALIIILSIYNGFDELV